MLAIDLTDPSVVSPGIAGFLTLFVLALAFIVLVRSMVGHLRKVRFQADREAAQQAAEAGASEAGASEVGSSEAGAADRPKG